MPGANFHQTRHAICHFVESGHVPILSNPICKFTILQSTRVPIPSNPHEISLFLANLTCKCPLNRQTIPLFVNSCSFTFCELWICSNSIEPDMQFHFSRNPDVSRSTFPFLCNSDVSQFHQIRHAICLFLNFGPAQFPSNPTYNFTFVGNQRCPNSIQSDMQCPFLDSSDLPQFHQSRHAIQIFFGMWDCAISSVPTSTDKSFLKSGFPSHRTCIFTFWNPDLL